MATKTAASTAALIVDALAEADQRYRVSHLDTTGEDLPVASTEPKIDVHTLRDLTGFSRTTIIRHLDASPHATRFSGWRDEPLFVYRSDEALAYLDSQAQRADALRRHLSKIGFAVSESDWVGATRYEGEDAVVAVDAEGKIAVMVEGPMIDKMFPEWSV